MKQLLTLIFICLLFSSNSLIAQDKMEVKTNSIYDFTMTSLDGKEISLEDYKGKTILIVNVASKCGLTPQYEDLQALHESHGEKGLAILGFPANNFMGQEPGTNEEIAAFCQKNYGVSFQMFSKISVKGKDTHPLYAFLKEKTGEEPGWNFHKYLVSKDGSEIISISPRDRVNQDDTLNKIEAKL
ncbi:MAG: glutathione peroxidase [Bacteroidota bacterium]